jgi:toxin-antitoxin system PIN domain toxin
MRHLCDSNVFIALTVPQHPAHEKTRNWVKSLVTEDTLGLCRLTEMSFLRLLTQKIAEGYKPLRNSEAVEKLSQWKKLTFVEVCAEPDSMETDWLRLAGIGQPAPKRWMDAYLATFAIHAKLRLVSLDADFEQYRPQGLDLLLLR